MSYAENYKQIVWSPFPRREPDARTPARSDTLQAPGLIRDCMDPVQSQATGKMYDSKSALRKEYKRLGLVEVGNDPQRFKPRKKPTSKKEDIHVAIQKAEARVNRGERNLYPGK